MKSRYPLASLYERDRQIKGHDSTHLTSFFKSTIGVSDACQEGFIEELEYLRDHGKEDFDEIENIYRELINIQNLNSKYLGARNPPVSRKAGRSSISGPPAPDDSRPTSGLPGDNPTSSHTADPFASPLNSGRLVFGSIASNSVGNTFQPTSKSSESQAIPSVSAPKSTTASTPRFGQHSGAGAVSSRESIFRPSISPRSQARTNIFAPKSTTSSTPGLFGSGATPNSTSSTFGSRFGSGFGSSSSSSTAQSSCE